MTLQDILKKAGFSEKEVDVYRVLISNKPMVASDVARAAGLNRSTTYVILETLLSRGIVKASDASAVRLFGPANPKDLVAYFERASSHYKELASATRSSLPSLTTLARSAGKKQSVESTYGAALASLGSLRGTKGQRERLGGARTANA